VEELNKDLEDIKNKAEVEKSMQEMVSIVNDQTI
jgi:hypothetical protein